MKSVYVIGSLRNDNVTTVARNLREYGLDVFDDWYAAGPEADDHWRDYEKSRNGDYSAALRGYAANHVFEFDKSHLDRCDAAVLVYPAGKSAHLELGYFVGQGKPGYVLLDGEPERYDVMTKFATAVFTSLDKMVAALKLWQFVPCLDHGGAGNSGGYASCKVDGRYIGKHVRALAHKTGGQPIGKYACHHCDNPRCIEPLHLFWGTQSGNLNDRKEKHAYRKLTRANAENIKMLLHSGESLAAVARMYDVSPGMIRHIREGRQWA
jgi:hypothetical protein